MSAENSKSLGNDIVELSRVWNNLSEDMQKLLSKAIAGEEYVEGTRAMISDLGKLEDNDENDVYFTIQDLEMLYMTDYEEDELEEDQGEDVLNFLQWLKEKC